MVKGKAVCLVCGVQVAVPTDYNLNRHYETKHAAKYKNMTVAEWEWTSEALLAKLQNQQGHFTKLHTSRDGMVRTSFVISHKIAKNSHSRWGSLLTSVWWTLQRYYALRKKKHLRMCPCPGKP